jgi:hypothetical protein
MTKVGFMVMIQKEGNNRFSGGAHYHQEQMRLGRSIFHCFSDVKGIVHQKLVPPNTTVNFDFCCDILGRSRQNLQRKGPNTGTTLTDSSRTCPHVPENQSL